LVQDCGLKKGPPLQYGDQELQDAVEYASEPPTGRATALALVAGGAGISGLTGPWRGEEQSRW
jgi:hypothetical protein